jgi:hypothetical protein
MVYEYREKQDTTRGYKTAFGWREDKGYYNNIGKIDEKINGK